MSEKEVVRPVCLCILCERFGLAICALLSWEARPSVENRRTMLEEGSTDEGDDVQWIAPLSARQQMRSNATAICTANDQSLRMVRAFSFNGILFFKAGLACHPEGVTATEGSSIQVSRLETGKPGH